MAEYIERQKVLDLAKTFSLDIDWDEDPSFLSFTYVTTNDIKTIPAADVRPVVRGKWSIVYDDFMKSNYTTCSCCGKEYFGANGFNFCPNCGADMMEES